MTEKYLNHKELYRMPISLTDNILSWLEVTSTCNLKCDGCYRENVSNSHKTLEEVKADLDVFESFRKMDSVSVAGGDPLVHPQITEIIAEISRRGYKPVINTNGLALTEELLYSLKQAGLGGFTFHIDSKQGRPNWKNKNEIDLCELRLEFARRVAKAGGISCAFNSTVYEDTLKYVPELVAWAQKHIDIVHSMVFIAFRQAVPNLNVDYFVGGEKVDMGQLQYSQDTERKINIVAQDIVKEIRTKFPDFSPCAYLNGTDKPDSFKWLLTTRIGSKEGKIYGYIGPKMMEMVQTQHHLWTGTYFAYSKPSPLWGSLSLLGGIFDPGTANAASNYFGNLIKNPLNAFKPLYLQSIVVIQPIDIDNDGGQNMCDSCPDITVHNGKLVWSCRLEEPKNFGRFTMTIPKEQNVNRQTYKIEKSDVSADENKDSNSNAGPVKVKSKNTVLV